MGWFNRLIKQTTRYSKAPRDLWFKCPGCGDVMLTRVLDENLGTCPICNLHQRITVQQRISGLFDQGILQEKHMDITSIDPLNFTDSRPYVDRMADARKKTGRNSALICGRGSIEGVELEAAIMDFAFMGGSMGSVVGEKVTLATEEATRDGLPLLLITASGGARMQEGILSLMQMAKTSAALARHHAAGLFSIALLLDPTTGGTTASFATLTDVLVSEPGALIGFAGPRVIEQTIREKLPPGFQRSEYLLAHGMLDAVVHRKEMRSFIGGLLKHAVAPVQFRREELA